MAGLLAPSAECRPVLQVLGPNGRGARRVGVTAGDTGVLLNNRMADWHLAQGHANRLAPGKRARHTMNAPRVFKDDKLWAVQGTARRRQSGAGQSAGADIHDGFIELARVILGTDLARMQ